MNALRRNAGIITILVLATLLGAIGTAAQTLPPSQQQGSFDLIEEEHSYNTFIITPTPVFVDPERCSPQRADLDPVFLIDRYHYGWLDGMWYYIPESPLLDAILDADLPLLIRSLNEMKAEDVAINPAPTDSVTTLVETQAGSQQQGIIIFDTPTPQLIPTVEETLQDLQTRRMVYIVQDLQHTGFICPVRINGY